MYTRFLLMSLVFASTALLPPVHGQDAPTDPNDEFDARDDRIAELEGQVGQLTVAYQDLFELFLELRAQLEGRAPLPTDLGDEYYIPRQAVEFDQSGQPAGLGGVYTKPFLAEFGENTYLGGYIDLEYHDSKGDDSRYFDQHRFVPFIYSDVADGVKVAAEVELEHGHEVEVEFAQIDLLVNQHANVRAGIQLLPLGKFNEVHDSPIQDLTNRPLLNRYIIPTTLRDAGIGVWGEITDTTSYNITATNGFRGLDAAGTSAISAEKGLRDAAPHSDTLFDPFENVDDNLAYTGRVAWRPLLGVETGLSGLVDTYDEAGDNDLTIVALDATVDGKAVSWLPDNMELLFEGARADVERDAFAIASGVAGNMEGHYVQANMHFAPDFLAECIDPDGGFVEDGAHFTFVTRYGSVELDDYTMRRTTVGLNFRPNETHTVLKLDYLMNDDSGSLAGTNDHNAWAFSVATYF